MTVAGLDIGSRTIALVEMDDGNVVYSDVIETTFDPLEQCRLLLEDRSFDLLVATGYGRHLAQANFADRTITEIKAFALGCYNFFPQCRTILDIGGQDTKAISLGQQGKVADFQMNDRCAAGTGKFLEVMAAAMGLSLEEKPPAKSRSPVCARSSPSPRSPGSSPVVSPGPRSPGGCTKPSATVLPPC
jgi:predicted CoA-substrate-specific enzyme activase